MTICQSPSPRLAISFDFCLIWQARLSVDTGIVKKSVQKNRVNLSERSRLRFIFLKSLSLPLRLFQESLVDFRFQKSWITVVFHQTVYQSLCPVKAIWSRLREIVADFFPRQYLSAVRKTATLYFTPDLFLFADCFNSLSSSLEVLGVKQNLSLA